MKLVEKFRLLCTADYSANQVTKDFVDIYKIMPLSKISLFVDFYNSRTAGDHIDLRAICKSIVCEVYRNDSLLFAVASDDHWTSHLLVLQMLKDANISSIPVVSESDKEILTLKRKSKYGK